jgi:receptor protein-tyrosine kinase
LSEVFVRYANEIVQKECVHITQRASLPWMPTGPKRVQNIAVSAAAALLVTISGVLALEMFNLRLKTDEQVENGLHLPVLGGIPNIRGKMKPYEKGRESPMQGIVRYIGNMERESFKTMAANIHFVAANPTVKTIAITSALSDEGMNAFMMLTAYAFAETGKSVLLVDMDYRNQSLGLYMRQTPALDLVDYLASRAQIHDIAMNTSIYNVGFIGNNHSSSLFTRVVASDGFLGFLREVETLYDVVLFHTPPLDLYIDAAVLASKVGGAVLVIPSNRIDIKRAKTAVAQVKRCGAAVLGIALTDVKHEKAKAYRRRPAARRQSGKL